MDAGEIQALADRLDAELRSAGTPERAQQEAAYLHSSLLHYGVPVPENRAQVKAMLRRQPLAHDDAVALAAQLWSEPVHERRLAAALLLVHEHRQLGLDDVPLIERMVRESRTWALSDVLSGDALGPALEQVSDQRAVTAVLDRWAEDDDLWIRRGALLVHERPFRAGGGNWDRFTRYADAMLDEKEFFIQKAIGWMLREAGRTGPDRVFEWVLPRVARASSVTLKEAVKNLSPEQQHSIRSRRR